MRHTTGAVMLIVWCESAMSGEPPVLPTPFEALALSPDVVVQDAAPVGELRSDDGTTATLTAVVLKDEEGNRIAGLRIRLQSNSASDTIYLDQAEIALAEIDLAELESGAPYLLDPNEDHGGALWRTQGTERCWLPASPQRILCPSYNVGPGGSSLGLHVLGGPYFSFPGRSPRELINLVEAASASAAN